MSYLYHIHLFNYCILLEKKPAQLVYLLTVSVPDLKYNYLLFAGTAVRRRTTTVRLARSRLSALTVSALRTTYRSWSRAARYQRCGPAALHHVACRTGPGPGRHLYRHTRPAPPRPAHHRGRSAEPGQHHAAAGKHCNSTYAPRTRCFRSESPPTCDPRRMASSACQRRQRAAMTAWRMGQRERL